MKQTDNWEGFMFPKPKRRKRRKTHKGSIKRSCKGRCFLCQYLYGDRSYKYTEEHHVLFGGGARDISEAEGLKADLCLEHHREGPEAVHNSQENRELLCRLFQEEYEKTHSREEWMQISWKNYREDE